MLYFKSFFLTILSLFTLITNKPSEIVFYDFSIDPLISIKEVKNDETINYEYYYDNKVIYKTNIDYINDKDYAVRNDTISFFYLDKNSLFIDIVNVSGEKETKTITLINANKIDVYYNDNNYYIFCEYNDDISIYIFDIDYNLLTSKTYNGLGKEEILDVIYSNDYFYVIIEKDLLSSLDYGNGGNPDNDKAIALLVIDKDLNIIDIKNFTELNYLNIELKLDNLIINFEDSVYIYLVDNDNLNLKIGLKFNTKSIFVKSMVNYNGIIYQARFLKNGIEVWDYNKLSIVYSNGYIDEGENSYYIDRIIERDDKYYGYLDNQLTTINGIYYLNSFKEEYEYIDEDDKPVNVNTYINSFNKEIKRTSFKTIGGFDSNKAGSYLTYYFYDDLELVSKQIVNPSYNVKEGLIYPLNYALEFNMKGILNGYEIFNNYVLNKEGDYHLELFLDNGELYKTINFKVDKNMININNESSIYREYDYYTHVDEIVNVSFIIEGIKSDEIDSIYVNKQEYKDYEVNNDKDKCSVTIYLKTLNRGINVYNINYVRLTNGKIYEVNDLIYIFGLDEELDYDVYANINNKIIDVNIDIEDINNTLRYFYVDYYKNKSLLHRDIYPITNNKIKLNKEYVFDNVNVGLTSDINYKNLIDKDIVSIDYGEINNNDYIEIKIASLDKSLNKLNLTINKTNNIKNISVGEEKIYSPKEYNYSLIVCICSVIIMVGILGIGLIYKKKIK